MKHHRPRQSSEISVYAHNSCSATKDSLNSAAPELLFWNVEPESPTLHSPNWMQQISRVQRHIKQTTWREFTSRTPLFQFIASFTGAGPAAVKVCLHSSLQSLKFLPGSKLTHGAHKPKTGHSCLMLHFSQHILQQRDEQSNGTETLVLSIVLHNRQLSVFLTTIKPSFLKMSTKRNGIVIGYVFYKPRSKLMHAKCFNIRANCALC